MAKDLRHIADPEEAAKVHALAKRLARRMRARLVRRERARRTGRRLDFRRTIHRSVAHGGTPIDLAGDGASTDHFASSSSSTLPARWIPIRPFSSASSMRWSGAARAEAFVFHTSLVHVSNALRERDVTRALDRLSLMAQGMGGGTRIGESLAAFNRWHATRVINSRTVIVIVSDGYDTGKPDRLGQEMARLSRHCRRIVWLNPLIGWRGYAPTARGMQAALCHVDRTAPAHNLASLAALEPYLARI